MRVPPLLPWLRPRPSRRFARAVALLSIVSCTTPRADTVADSTRVLFPAEGTWQEGDEQITFRSAPRDSLLEVTEQVTFGTDGVAQRTLHYYRARPIRFEESRTQTAQAGDRSPGPMRVSLSITFAADSTAAAASKLVDGAAVPVREYEIARAYRHAVALLDAFRTTPVVRRR